MTPGLAFFYGGLVCKKNVLTLIMQSFICFGLIMFIWVFGGFSLAFGKDIGGIIGSLEFFGLSGVGLEPNPSYAATIPFILFFGFQLMFATITPAIISGAFVGRVDIKNYIKFIILWAIFIYIPLCHWTFGGGFLAQWGVVDFAGGIAIHISAGMSALASVIVLGKRKVESEVSTSNNVPLVMVGGGILWAGWLAFNGGSALSANGIAALALVNTHIAACAGMMTWLVITKIRNQKMSLIGAITGAIVGLVAITPGVGFVKPWAAIIIAIITTILAYMAIVLKTKLGWDDTLDVWAAHGVGGMLGMIFVGVFADSSICGISGLIEGNITQLIIQIKAVGIAVLYSYVGTYLIFKLLNIKALPVNDLDMEYQEWES